MRSKRVVSRKARIAKGRKKYSYRAKYNPENKMYFAFSPSRTYQTRSK